MRPRELKRCLGNPELKRGSPDFWSLARFPVQHCLLPDCLGDCENRWTFLTLSFFNCRMSSPRVALSTNGKATPRSFVGLQAILCCPLTTLITRQLSPSACLALSPPARKQKKVLSPFLVENNTFYRLPTRFLLPVF